MNWEFLEISEPPRRLQSSCVCGFTALCSRGGALFIYRIHMMIAHLQLGKMKSERATSWLKFKAVGNIWDDEFKDGFSFGHF